MVVVAWGMSSPGCGGCLDSGPCKKLGDTRGNQGEDKRLYSGRRAIPGRLFTSCDRRGGSDAGSQDTELVPAQAVPRGCSLDTPAQHPGLMAAGTPTLFLNALLCLGTPQIPSIQADPDPRVPKGGSVTIWCIGPPEASEFRLYKVNDSEWEYMEKSLAHRGQAYISLRNLNIHRAGQYQCSYSSAHHPEQRSDPLTLVLTGLFHAPSLEAHVGPVVASGGNVSLSCSTLNMTGTFHLLKEGDAEPQKLEPQFSQGRWQANFLLDSVNASHRGNYTCYLSASSQPLSWSLPSAPLRLQVTGVFDPPSLSAQPGPLVQSGDNVTLRCSSEKFSVFALTKGDSPPHSLHGQPSPDFPLSPVSAFHGGRYRCFGGHDLDLLWSEPSGPLDILVAGTGTGSSPELQALPEPHVPVGGDITLLCRSADSADTFYLAQEGSAAEPLQCLLPHPAAPSQANFTLRGLGPAQNITYRCYTSNSSAPHLLSPPSQPLRLQVSGELDSLTLLLGLSGALLGLLLLLLLLLFFRHRYQQAAHQKSNAAVTHTQSEEGARMNPQMYINHEDHQEVTYAQVNCARLRKQVST
ncbi:leukocyte immunoglobulin-like receptor subfamily A member 6 [Suncus etruscus]|uniref:leukocyte immunoglobulin-like receptor subfamily A member 6 n=1 Tax=Suncus etruscus TaxID=109475 RepID=UPI00210FE158|nr:leukocyte immunoglobulin-like receptor subfamily A member 6 [Suncus etruscus]